MEIPEGQQQYPHFKFVHLFSDITNGVCVSDSDPGGLECGLV